MNEFVEHIHSAYKTIVDNILTFHRDIQLSDDDNLWDTVTLNTDKLDKYLHICLTERFSQYLQSYLTSQNMSF